MLDAISDAVVWEESGLVQSLENVLGRIEVIADVTVKMMDEISKVYAFQLPLLHANISMKRYTYALMRLGKS